jgi:hypothetical protein
MAKIGSAEKSLKSVKRLLDKWAERPVRVVQNQDGKIKIDAG